MAKNQLGKRVLFLAPYLGDGGINVEMLELGTELRKRGWEVGLCTGKPLDHDRHTAENGGSGTDRTGGPPRIGDYARAGITPFEVVFPRRVYRLRGVVQLLRLPVSMWHVLRAVRRFRPSLLHAQSRQMGLYARVVQLVTGVPFVSSAYVPIPTRNRLWASTVGARAFAISAETADILARDYAVDPSRVQVVVSGVDAERFRPPNPEELGLAQQHYGIRPHQFVLAFIGSLTPNKSADTLVNAVADLSRMNREVLALVAGEGPEEVSLRALTSKLGIVDRVLVLGYEDARRVLWAADALVLPSKSEGFGRVMAEAMLCGVIVVRTPAGGADLLRQDVTGIVFAHGDHEQLAQRIADLIDRPEFRETVSANALADAREHFSTEHMAGVIEEAYLEVLEEQR